MRAPLVVPLRIKPPLLKTVADPPSVNAPVGFRVRKPVGLSVEVHDEAPAPSVIITWPAAPMDGGRVIEYEAEAAGVFTVMLFAPLTKLIP